MEIAVWLERLDTVMNFKLFTLQGSPITLITILFFLVVIVGSVLLSKYLRSLFQSRFSDRFKHGMDYTINRLIHYIILLIGLFIGLEVVGLDLSSLTIVAGFLSVGIGFGLQNIASNFISGLILMFERPIAVGDLVTVNEELGTIQAIGLRATIVNSVDNIEIIIPNSMFVEEEVINWSHGDPKIRLRCPVGVAYGTDPGKVRDLLLEIAEEREEILEDPEPTVIFKEFDDSSLNFELRVWIGDPGPPGRIKNNLNFAINQRFAEEDIEMPFPQRDLHLRSSDVDLGHMANK